MPRIVDRDKVRAQLLERCVEIFADEGFAGLTMRRLARALEVSTGTLYHYFPSKEAVFEGVVQAVSHREIQAAMASLATRAEDPVTTLLTYVEANEQRLVQQFLVLVEYLRTRSVNPGSEAVRGALSAYHERFFEAMGQALGIEDRRAAVAVFLFLRGLLLQRYLDGGNTPLHDHTPTLRALIAS